ncbi:MAG: T9SS type A sorting domain-containing protein [Bacteroidota bacterium]|nr:T9SS type A sorting domain-containing protein [Bacteroidota bacterium]
MVPLLFFPQTISAQWETLGNTPYAYGNGPALFVYFLAPMGQPNVGYCSFENLDTLYKTTDFGKTWKANFASPFSTYNNYVTDIAFKDSLHGWICTADATYSGDRSKMSGRVYSTSDGGNSWQEASPMTGSYWELNYNPLSHCLIADGNEITSIVISRDDGATFTRIGDIGSLYYEYMGILFIEDSTILIFGDGQHYYQNLRSTDAGLTWTKISVPSSNAILHPYYSSESCQAFYIGGQTLFVSSDKGLTWNARYTFAKPTNGQIVGACGYIATAYSSPNLYDSATVLLSSDYGRTWQDIGKHYQYNGSLFDFMKMDPTGIYLINNGVIQRYSLPKLLLIYTGSPTTYVTPNGFETDIPLFSKTNCFDVIVSLSSWNDATSNVVSSTGWDIVTKQLGPGLYELIGTRNGGDSLSGTLQICQNITDIGEQTVTIEPDPLDAATLASCEESKTTYNLPGCGSQTLSDFMRTGKLPEFTIFPNPAENSINIRSSVNGNADVKIFDQLGRAVVSSHPFAFGRDQNTSIDVSKLASGIYFVRIEYEGFVRNREIVVNH